MTNFLETRQTQGTCHEVKTIVSILSIKYMHKKSFQLFRIIRIRCLTVRLTMTARIKLEIITGMVKKSSYM